MAIEVVPELPAVNLKLPGWSVIDEEINSGIVGIAKLLVHGLLQQLLTEAMQSSDESRTVS